MTYLRGLWLVEATANCFGIPANSSSNFGAEATMFDLR
jgi:hypothetical protein